MLRKATQRPSAEITGWSEEPLPAAVALPALRLTRVVASVVLSKRKTSRAPFVSTCPATRWAALLAKTTYRPSAESDDGGW